MALKTLTRQVLSLRQKSLVAPCGIVVSRRMNMNTKPASPAVRGKFVFEYDREKEKFKDVLPIIFDEIIQKHCSDLPETKEHLRHALAARFPFVQVERGMRMLEIYTLSTHPLEITEDTMRGARVIALCGEMIVASFYTLDDMLDNIQTRYGKPAFHLQFPTTAVLDATLLSHVIHLLLQEHIKRRIQVRDAVMDLFHSTTVRTTVGLIQDRLLKDGAVKNPRTAFKAFTIEKYRETVINKIGYMAFSLPIGEILLHSKDLSSDERGVTSDLGLDFSGCGLIYAGRPFERTIQKALLNLGLLLEAEANMRDTGFWGNAVNIHGGWMSWPTVRAKELASQEQLDVLIDNYGHGSEDKEAEERVMDILEDLQIEKEYFKYRDSLVADTRELIRKSQLNDNAKIFLQTMVEEIIAGEFFRAR